MRCTCLLPLILITGCAAPAFEQLSYFKDAGPNRVFVLRATQPIDTQAVETHARGLNHTDGRFTMAFYLDESAPDFPDRVTMAASYPDAIEAMDSAPPWRWRAVTGPDGRFTLTDCQITPQADGCPA